LAHRDSLISHFNDFNPVNILVSVSYYNNPNTNKHHKSLGIALTTDIAIIAILQCMILKQSKFAAFGQPRTSETLYPCSQDNPGFYVAAMENVSFSPQM